MLGTPVALMRRARTQIDLELIPASTRWLVRSLALVVALLIASVVA